MEKGGGAEGESGAEGDKEEDGKEPRHGGASVPFLRREAMAGLWKLLAAVGNVVFCSSSLVGSLFSPPWISQAPGRRVSSYKFAHGNINRLGDTTTFVGEEP